MNDITMDGRSSDMSSYFLFIRYNSQSSLMMHYWPLTTHIS